MYTANSVVDSELQLAEPLPVSFPIYPLGGGKAGAELQAAGSLPLFFYYKKIYKPKKLNRAIGKSLRTDGSQVAAPLISNHIAHRSIHSIHLKMKVTIYDRTWLD